MSHKNEMRDRILNAVEDLVATRGVNNFSLRDICDSLYISTGSLYYHFKTKDEIILAIINKHFNELEKDYIDWLNRHKEKGDLTKDRFIEVVLYKGTELFNRSKIHMYLINECMRDNSEIKESYNKLLKDWYEKLVEGVKQVFGDREDVRAFTYMLMLIIEGQTIRVALGDRNLDMENRVKSLLREI